MSKRGTENQITKDDYDREEDDDSSLEMGTFKKASNEELARRPMKALRRLGPRTSSNLSDDGAKRPSPFATLGASSTPSSTPSSQSSIEEPAKPVNPFANFTFASTTAAPSATAPQPTSVKGLGEPATLSTPSSQEATSVTHDATSVTTFTPVTTSAFPKSTFTFNIGSKPSQTGLETFATTNGDGSVGSLSREQYERWLRSMNQAFLKKIQKELEFNPTVNLSQIFNQYMQHRMTVRKAYIGDGSQDSPVMKDANGKEDASKRDAGSATKITRIGAGGADSPKMGFGLPFDVSASTEGKGSFSFAPPKADNPLSVSSNPFSAAPSATASSPSAFPSLTGTSSFTFGSSSVKGAVNPPKNPTAFSFGTPLSNPFGSPTATSTTTLAASSAATTGTSTSAASPFSFASSKPFDFSNPAQAGTTVGGGSEAPKPFAFSVPGVTGSSAGGEPPKPFGIPSPGFAASTSGGVGGTPKPFSFSSPALGNVSAGGATPSKPFMFQVPSVASSISSSPDVSQDGDNEKMPDDTKSQLVDNREGEEGEETVFEVRARLYGVVNGENKDLGVGQFRVNENTNTKRRRMIMRTGGTGLITLNSWIVQGMPAKREKTVITLFAIEDNKPKRFMLRVKEESSAEELYNALEKGQVNS
ncbi:MAG: hypothetical protein J3Q66DRAFT_180883 [Benniella sp.]|nr:MAG: hypothetical protein J3Q66DRAFT_180883 [Benniella sp.]